jgi:class 3 adenylate cyclase
MARLAGRKRSTLPDSAFAYVDSHGRRRLPIHDESHVRNALSRFNQVVFEDDHARERARKRLLTAAKKYGIVPIGFITGQLQAERTHAAAGRLVIEPLPSGFVTLLMTDIEGSTALLHRLGPRYEALLNTIRRAVRAAISHHRGREIDVRADECFAVFEDAGKAVAAAVAAQRGLLARQWPGGVEVRIRIGLHSGRPTLTKSGYIGLPVHTVARVCAAAHGGQILLSGETRIAMEHSKTAAVRFRAMGRQRLTGLPNPVALFQVEAERLPSRFPPLRVGARSRRRRETAVGAAPADARTGAAQLRLGLDRES